MSGDVGQGENMKRALMLALLFGGARRLSVSLEPQSGQELVMLQRENLRLMRLGYALKVVTGVLVVINLLVLVVVYATVVGR